MQRPLHHSGPVKRRYVDAQGAVHMMPNEMHMMGGMMQPGATHQCPCCVSYAAMPPTGSSYHHATAAAESAYGEWTDTIHAEEHEVMAAQRRPYEERVRRRDEKRA